MDLGGWLRSLGLERYEAAFRANAIDADVLCDLTDQDLEKLGVLLGHRRKLLRAIAALDDALAPATAPSTTATPIARDQSSHASPSENHFEAPASGECVHVTVMSCSLVDSKGASPSTDTEDWRDLLGAYLHAASVAVTDCNGTVAEKLDDGLIALFAFAVTQQNDLDRAAHAARAIQQSVAELNRRNGSKPRLAVRIVIQSGPTVIDGDSNIFGELRNVAARAQPVAQPNSLTIATLQRQIPAAEERDSHKRQVPREVALTRTIFDGRPMSYHQLIARAVDGLGENTGEARRRLYERARNALVAQLGSTQPVLVLADITKERLALEKAIRKVEAEAARNSRRESRTETQDLRSAGNGSTPDADGQSAPLRGSSPNPSRAHLRPVESFPVLSGARNRLLSGLSTQKEAVDAVRDSDVQELGQAAIEATKADRQRRDANAHETLRHLVPEEPVQSSRDVYADRNDLNSYDEDIPQRRGHESAYEPADDPVVLPPGYARSAPQRQNDSRRRQQFSYPVPSSLPRANWSLPLPHPIVVSGVMTVATLNDAWALIERHLQGDSRAKEMWRYVSHELRGAALGDDAADFSSVLEMALSLEGLEYALK